jgi:hypothetical protein
LVFAGFETMVIEVYALTELTKESIVEKTCSSENLPSPLFACPKTGKGCQRGVIPPFGKGREGGIYLQCLYNYGLTNNSVEK